MQKTKFIQSLVALFGIIGIGIGAALLFIPSTFEASAGIAVGQDVNLLNELRAYGGTILVAGLIVGIGAVIPRFLVQSLGFSGLFYLGIGFSRLVSMLIDGMPSQTLMIAMISELVIGAISLLLLSRVNRVASVEMAKSA